jgi:hypothetical protein
MMLPKALALVSTVLLLMSLVFSVLGATPLLILKHDVLMDSRVIRQVFHYSYLFVAVTAAAASVGYALTAQPGLSVGLALMAVLAVALRRGTLARMDTLRASMPGGDANVIQRFRRLHVTGIVLNLTQLAVVGGALTLVRL